MLFNTLQDKQSKQKTGPGNCSVHGLFGRGSRNLFSEQTDPAISQTDRLCLPDTFQNPAYVCDLTGGREVLCCVARSSLHSVQTPACQRQRRGPSEVAEG